MAGVLLATSAPSISSDFLEGLKSPKEWQPKPIKRGEFFAKFRENKDLLLSEFDVFPHDIRKHLGVDNEWREDQFNGFSKAIKSRLFLIIVTDMTGNYYSKAVLLNLNSRTEPVLHKNEWEPLHLPNLKQKDRGWSVVVNRYHEWLQWNEDLNALQGIHCSDISTTACIRHTTRIDWYQLELLRVEIDRSRTFTDWEPIWESGQWLIDPENVDFDTR